jgi:hypothetical protein
MFNSMSADTCAALAQVVPVFLIALIAERVRTPRIKDDETTSRRLAIILRATFRALSDLLLAIVLVALEITVVVGIEAGGMTGEDAQQNWGFFILVTIWTLLRWLLANPIVQAAYTAYWRFAGWLTGALLDGFATLLDGMLRGISAFIGATPRGIDAMSRGLVRLIASLADWILKLPR